MIIALFLTGLQTKAQQWTPFSTMDASEPVCTILNSDRDSVTFKVEIPGMYSVNMDSLQRKWVGDTIWMAGSTYKMWCRKY
nr:hypothetical protein [Bacteroidota bacterium]